MITLLKKYWLSILLFLVWVIILLYFNPRQKQFYLETDIDQFESKSHLALMVMEIVLLMLILVLSKIKEKKQFFYVSIGLVIGLFFFYMFFQRTFTSIGLFINRQTAGNDSKRSFVVQYFDDDKRDKNNFYLYDIDKKHLIMTEHKLLDSLYTFGFHKNDTIHIHFTKGLLGIPYFKDPIVDKK